MKEKCLLNEMQTRLLQSVVEEEVFCFLGFFFKCSYEREYSQRPLEES